jgi:aminoglycoside phosphotransferase (APT) family kinase protein
VEREFRVLQSLHSQTAIPVAEPYLLCTDESVIGTWFYIMDYVEGRIFWDTSFPEVDAAARAHYFDWELSTLGHPLVDFAYHLMMYRMPTLMFTGLVGMNLPELGIPDEKHYVKAYNARTGRDTIEDLDFFVAFSFFRLAAILHGIRGRLIRGTAASPRATEYARHVEIIAELGWQQARRRSV